MDSCPKIPSSNVHPILKEIEVYYTACVHLYKTSYIYLCSIFLFTKYIIPHVYTVLFVLKLALCTCTCVQYFFSQSILYHMCSLFCLY